MSEIAIANWNTLEPGKPAYALVGNVDLVVIRWPDEQRVAQPHDTLAIKIGRPSFFITGISHV